MFTVSHFSQQPPIEAGVPKALAQWRAARYSDVRYKLNLTLEKMSPVLKGTIEIRVNVSPLPKGTLGPGGLSASVPPAVAGGEVPPIILDWRKIPGHEKDSTISNVTVNGLEVSEVPAESFLWKKVLHFYFDKNEHLVFPDGIEPGENVIKLDFTSPILASGSAITRYVDKEDGSEYLYSLFVPSDASTAFPVFDQPDLKAKFALSLEVPELSWNAISNGKPHRRALLISELNPYRTRFFVDFEETKPISTYVFAFAAGPWEEFDEAGGAGGNLSGSEGVPTGVGKPWSSNAQRDTLATGRVSASDAGKSNQDKNVRSSEAGGAPTGGAGPAAGPRGGERGGRR
jgi:aminopeptidase N